MSHFSVTIDGKRTDYTGIDAFFKSCRDANRAERPNKNGLCSHHVVWKNEEANEVRSVAYPGIRTGCS